MKQIQRMILLLILTLGSVFSVGCGQVDELRLALGQVSEHKAKIVEVEKQLEAVIVASESQKAAFNATFDTNKDGVVTKEEVTGNKIGMMTLVMDTFKTGDWKQIGGMILLFVFVFFGLHGADPRAKLAQYGTKGMLGWVFRLAGALGTKPKPKPGVIKTEAKGPDT